jgi:pimeloyl-ACP methyl ester carboxylesterase
VLDRHKAAAAEAARIMCPMLVIGAGCDRMTPPDVVRRDASRYPTATYREFADHGHWLVGEPGSDKVAAGVIEWLKGQSIRP